MKIIRLDIKEIDEIFDSINGIIQEKLKKASPPDKHLLYETIRYLSHIKRTPLPLNTTFTGFARWSQFSDGGGKTSIYKFIDQLQTKKIDIEIINKIRQLAQRYKDSHPICNTLVKCLKDLKTEKAIIMVHKNDVTKLGNTLSTVQNQNDYLITDWSRLERRVSSIQTKIHLIIIEPPYSGDLLFLDNTKDMTIIGAPSNNQEVEKALNFILNFKTRPYFLKPNENAPELLKYIEKKVEEKEKMIPELEEIKEQTITMNWAWENIIGGWEEEQIQREEDKKDTQEYVPTELIRAIGEDNTCIFFPPHSHLAWRDENRSGINSAEELCQQEKHNFIIFLSKKELPIKVLLADWMANEAPPTIRHSARGYTWSSLEELLLDSVEWIEILKEKAEEIGSQPLAEKLSKLKLTARDPDYIRKWWERYEEPPIYTPSGRKIRAPEIERPQNINDLEKIAVKLQDKNFELNVGRIYYAVLEIQRIRAIFISKAKEMKAFVDENGINEKTYLGTILEEFAEDLNPYKVVSLNNVNYDKTIPLHRITKLTT